MPSESACIGPVLSSYSSKTVRRERNNKVLERSCLGFNLLIIQGIKKVLVTVQSDQKDSFPCLKHVKFRISLDPFY